MEAGTVTPHFVQIQVSETKGLIHCLSWICFIRTMTINGIIPSWHWGVRENQTWMPHAALFSNGTKNRARWCGPLLWLHCTWAVSTEFTAHSAWASARPLCWQGALNSPADLDRVWLEPSLSHGSGAQRMSGAAAPPFFCPSSHWV